MSGYKAPFISKTDVGTYFFRPTPKLLEAFPHLERKTFETKIDANAYSSEVVRLFAKYKRGEMKEDTSHNPRSVAALVDYYKDSMAYKTMRTDTDTRRSYSDHINHAFPIVLGKKPFYRMLVHEIDYDYVQAMWLHIENAVSTHKANHTFKVLKLVWNEGLRGGRVKANPFSLVKLPKLPDRQVLWDMDQIRGMIKYCDDADYPSLGTMITMCYEFCQRPVDVRKMKWSNIDGKTGVSNFRQTKTGKQMSIKVTNDVQKRLHLHRRRNSDDYIFAYEGTNKPYSQDRVCKFFRKMADGYGLPKVPLVGQFDKEGVQKYSTIWLADLRRTGATHASRMGCTDRELVALTGHKNPQMLLVYAVAGEIESTNANIKRGLLDA